MARTSCARHRLAVHRPEPAKSHQLRDPSRVIAIRFHRHRFERIAHVPRLQKFDRKPGLFHCHIKPLRQWSRFQPDPPKPKAQGTKPPDQRCRLALDLRLANNLATPVHNTHA
jgi:hypothetical protein